MTPAEKTLQFLVEYVFEESYPIRARLPKREASRKLSLMICKLIAVNGFEIRGQDGGGKCAFQNCNAIAIKIDRKLRKKHES